MTLYIFESSAYKYISELGSSAAQSSGRSFMYIKNNKGSNMLPCGIRLSTLNRVARPPEPTPSERKTSLSFDSAYLHTDSDHAECVFLHSVQFGTCDV